MEKIEPSLWKKCVDHMLKEMEYYMELDGITASSEFVNKAGPSNTQVQKSDSLPLDVKCSNEIPSTSAELIMKLKSKWPKLSVAQPNIESKSVAQPVIESTTLKCSKCDFETTKKNCLDRHVEGHYDCDQCGQTFVGKNAPRSFARHMKSHEAKSVQVTTCSICKMDYKEAWRSRRHQNVCKKNQ